MTRRLRVIWCRLFHRAGRVRRLVIWPGTWSGWIDCARCGVSLLVRHRKKTWLA